MLNVLIYCFEVTQLASMLTSVSIRLSTSVLGLLNDVYK